MRFASTSKIPPQRVAPHTQSFNLFTLYHYSKKIRCSKATQFKKSAQKYTKPTKSTMLHSIHSPRIIFFRRPSAVFQLSFAPLLLQVLGRGAAMPFHKKGRKAATALLTQTPNAPRPAGFPWQSGLSRGQGQCSNLGTTAARPFGCRKPTALGVQHKKTCLQTQTGFIL